MSKWSTPKRLKVIIRVEGGALYWVKSKFIWRKVVKNPCSIDGIEPCCDNSSRGWWVVRSRAAVWWCAGGCVWWRVGVVPATVLRRLSCWSHTPPPPASTYSLPRAPPPPYTYFPQNTTTLPTLRYK